MQNCKHSFLHRTKGTGMHIERERVHKDRPKEPEAVNMYFKEACFNNSDSKNYFYSELQYDTNYEGSLKVKDSKQTKEKGGKHLSIFFNSFCRSNEQCCTT